MIARVKKQTLDKLREKTKDKTFCFLKASKGMQQTMPLCCGM
jgi:hypothetical protein